MLITRSIPQLDAATRIAAGGFCQPLSPALEDDVAGHLASGDLIYTATYGAETVGFAIFDVYGDVLYLSGVILEPRYQRRENIRALVARARCDAPDVRYLVLRTQSSRMWSAGFKLCSSWYPSLVPADVPIELVEVGEKVAAHIGSRFPVSEGYYGAPLYGDKPRHHDAVTQARWDSLCQFELGDAVVCVGELAD